MTPPRPASRLPDLYDQMEALARADGLTLADADMAPGSRLHQWIQANVRYRPETEWFLIFELSCRLGAQPTQETTT